MAKRERDRDDRGRDRRDRDRETPRNEPSKARRRALATGLGAFDPMFRRWAQKLAAQVPRDSIIRQVGFESVAGALRAFVEDAASAWGPLAEALVEKATDFVDFFYGALGVVGPEKVAKTTHDWIAKFREKAMERLSQAPDHAAEGKKIKEEFEILRELSVLMDAATAPHAPLPGEKFEEKADAAWEKVKKFLAELDQKSEELAEKIRELRKSRIASRYKVRVAQHIPRR